MAPLMALLCTAPQIGPVTASTFASAVDKPERFANGHQVSAYFGLVPSELSSGEKQRTGRITKAGNTRVRFNIETKIDPNHPDESLDPRGFVAKLLQLIEAEGFSDRVMIQSFDWRTLLLVQQQAPTIPTVYLTLQRGSGQTVALDKATNWTAGFSPADHGGSLPRTIKAAGGTVWSPYFGDVTEAVVSEAHTLGLRIVVWTVNKREDMARMIELGVDGIISDRPDLLRQVAGEKGIALPAGTPVVP